MSDLVARLRNWREVHLARLHLLMEEAADEMERLSKTEHCPAPETRTNPDNVGKELAQEIACLRSDISRRANLESGLRAGVVQLQDEVRRLESVIAASQPTFTPVAAEQDNDRRLAALQALTDLDEKLGLPRRTPHANATPSEGSVQNRCTLTDEEREAVAYFAAFHQSPREADANAAATLRGLLERLGGGV